MTDIQRQSPVRFTAAPLKTEVRDQWTVALEYEDEGPGPWIVDLAHKPRWDLQDKAVGNLRPCDLGVPDAPGACMFSGETLINRMNRTQASIYHVGASAPDLPDASIYTDTTEGSVFLALFGPKAFRVAEKLTALDLQEPGRQPPFLVQGPFCHVPCQIVVLNPADDDAGGFLCTCSRGYGDAMVHAVLDAGAAFGLRPAGERRFEAWIQSLQNKPTA